jgi:6-phosphogluconolactonase
MLKEWDARREIAIPGDESQTIAYAVEHWIHTAKRAIQQRGRFAVALSGGSTPKAIYKALSKITDLDWSKVYLFWSDERAVPHTHPDSNYKMTLDTGLLDLVPPTQIFPMPTDNLEQNAISYEALIQSTLDKHLFDLVMLGVGEDGHTASLFPDTKALEATTLVAANHIPQKTPKFISGRLTLTFPCINNSYQTAIYALGANKELIIPKVLDAPILSHYPASRLGTPEHKALWILDTSASKYLTLD